MIKKTRLFWSIVLFILISPDIALSFINFPKEAYLVTKDGTIINATAIEKINKILTFETNGLPGFVKTSEVVKILAEDPSPKNAKNPALLDSSANDPNVTIGNKSIEQTLTDQSIYGSTIQSSIILKLIQSNHNLEDYKILKNESGD